MIIVEGPDGAGKSSLITSIMAVVQELNVGQRNPDRSQLWRTGATDVYKAIADDVNPMSTCQIWDRLFFSELVYAPIMDRECCFNSKSAAYTTRLLVANRALVIWCMPGLATIEENCAGTAQHPWVRGNETVIYSAYARLHATWTQKSGAEALTYNYHRLQPVDIIPAIHGHIDRRKEMVPREHR